VKVVPLHPDEGGIVVDDYPLIEPGEYTAVYTGHATMLAFNRPKVYVYFRIVDGAHTGAKLFRAYRVKALAGKPRKNGRFVVRRSYALFREFATVTGAHERPDRIALTSLRNCVLRVSVRTVDHDYQQRPLPEACRYSVVDQMLAVEAGTPA
jgi:hypothetical protein